MNESVPSPDAEIKAAYDSFFDNNEVPVILVCGKTGAGKSSILNALAGNQVREVGVVPTTRFQKELNLNPILWRFRPSMWRDSGNSPGMKNGCMPSLLPEKRHIFPCW